MGKTSAVRPMRPKKRVGPIFTQFAIYMILSIVILLAAFPLIVTIFSSLKSNYELANSLFALPKSPRFENWAVGFHGMGLNLFNSLVVCLISTLGVLALSSITAYVMVRHDFPGKEVIFAAILALMIVPLVLTLTSSYILMINLRIKNTWWALISQYVSSGQVGAIFLFRTFFAQQPTDMFEAARIDGAGDFAMYARITLPLAIPVLAIQAVNTFAGIYNDFLWPSLVIDNQSIQTLMPVLRTFTSPIQGLYLDKGVMYSAFLVSGLPLVVTTALGLKYFINGDFASGLKL